MQQMSLGNFLKNQGMKRSVDAANRHIPGWSDQALQYLKDYPGEVFQAEDVRAWAYKNGLPKPKSGRAWGSVITKTKKQGIIVFVGYEAVNNPKAHSTPAAVWRRNNA